MALIRFAHFSNSLRMQMEAYVVIPQPDNYGEIGIQNRKNGEGKLKCLYLLHGLSDDHTIWERRTGIERYASQYGIAVVMPHATRSFYTDMKYGGKFYTYISEELPRLITWFFNISDRPEDNFVAGLSMGGYGALKIGLRNPDRFCACAGLSSAVDLKRRVEGNEWPELYVPIFGTEGKVPPEDDLYEIAALHAGDENRPRIFMGCGTEDVLYEENVQYRDFLREKGYDLTYRESHGIHEWGFWDEYIQYVLQWLFEEGEYRKEEK